MNQRIYTSALLAATLVAFGHFAPSAAGGWLDVDPATFTPVAGTFTGVISSPPTSVFGTFHPGIQLRNHLTGPGGTHAETTYDGTSPQFSYAPVFNPTILLTDRVGYNKTSNSMPAVSRIEINFSPPLTDPVFHIANLDNSTFDFGATITTAATPVVMSLMPGSGNAGPDGDGLGLLGTVLHDLRPATTIGQAPTAPPRTNGLDRSAYGSVLLSGTYAQLLIDVDVIAGTGDSGNFTISTVPEPGGLIVAVASLYGLTIRRRRLAPRK